MSKTQPTFQPPNFLSSFSKTHQVQLVLPILLDVWPLTGGSQPPMDHTLKENGPPLPGAISCQELLTQGATLCQLSLSMLGLSTAWARPGLEHAVTNAVTTHLLSIRTTHTRFSSLEIHYFSFDLCVPPCFTGRARNDAIA